MPGSQATIGPAVHVPGRCYRDGQMAGFDGAAALTAARRSDQRAWDAIVARYSNLVWSVARSFRFNSSDAADVYQATWLRLVEHIGEIRDGERLGSWLATTARREALALLRRGRVERPADDVELLPGVAADATVPVEGRLLEQEEQAHLWHAFSHLPDNCQRTLRVLFADPPPSYAEISAALDMPMGTIGPTRTRCLAHLRSLLSRREPS